MTQNHTKEIQTYYDECNRDYEIVWQLKETMALHYGYWDENTLTHRQALWNTNYQIAKHAQIKTKDHVLDAGCGIGGTSLFLSNNIGCRVHGISLSPHQIDQALLNKEALDKNNLTSFSFQDYTNTDFKENTFDVVIAMESAMYSEPKDAFLKESFRILKPGGRLLVADYFTRDTRNKLEVETLNKWGSTWMINEFISEKRYLANLEKIGYKNVMLDDLSSNFFPSIKLMHRSYYPGLFISKISNLFGNRTNAQVENSKSGKYQYHSFKQGVWRYKHLIAFKPPVALNISNYQDYMTDLNSITPYIDNQKLSVRFPIISKNRVSIKNALKRLMHFYLEKNIRDPNKWF